MKNITKLVEKVVTDKIDRHTLLNIRENLNYELKNDFVINVRLVANNIGDNIVHSIYSCIKLRYGKR